MTARFSERVPQEEVAKCVAEEIARHEAAAQQEHYVKTDGQWTRQGIEVTASGKIVGHFVFH